MERAAANVIEKAGLNVVDGATGFGSLVFNGLIGDRVREWRTRNMLRGSAKTADLIREMGIDLSKAAALPILEFYSIFEGMSEQDDLHVSELWSGLLASRMNPSSRARFDREIVEILKVLSGDEARILKFVIELERLSNAFEIFRRTIDRKPDDISQSVWEEQRRARLIEWKDDRFDSVTALYNECLSKVGLREQLEATEFLVLKKLIYMIDRVARDDSLVSRGSIRSDYGHGLIEVVDASKVAAAINSLITGSSETGYLTQRSGIFSLSKPEFYIRIKLTDFGRRLVETCHPTRKAQ